MEKNDEKGKPLTDSVVTTAQMPKKEINDKGKSGNEKK